MADPNAHMYTALMSYLDGMVGNVVDLLKERQMWDDTLLCFSR
jgi:arylsulfatase A-like enzyme